ncbi:MAG: redoxin domain-containing protein [Anaerolineales bacterium]|nr:redoxin domain-containing protein [Anaerolineales bacterium]
MTWFFSLLRIDDATPSFVSLSMLPNTEPNYPTWSDKMSKVVINAAAPDFALPDMYGETVRLSDFRGRKHVFLVFNRGFI